MLGIHHGPSTTLEVGGKKQVTALQHSTYPLPCNIAHIHCNAGLSRTKHPNQLSAVAAAALRLSRMPASPAAEFLWQPPALLQPVQLTTRGYATQESGRCSPLPAAAASGSTPCSPLSFSCNYTNPGTCVASAITSDLSWANIPIHTNL